MTPEKKMSVWIVFDDFLKFMIKLFLLCHLEFIDIVHAVQHVIAEATFNRFNQDRFEDYFHRVSETWLLRFRVAFDMFPGSRIRFFPPVPSLGERVGMGFGHENEHGTLIRGHQKGYETIMKVKLYGTLGGVMGHHVEHYGFI